MQCCERVMGDRVGDRAEAMSSSPWSQAFALLHTLGRQLRRECISFNAAVKLLGEAVVWSLSNTLLHVASRGQKLPGGWS